jgi:ribosome-associated protein
MDYVDFVVHIFLAERREFYKIERLRSAATVLDVKRAAKQKPAAKKLAVRKKPAVKKVAKKAVKKPAAKKKSSKKM